VCLGEQRVVHIKFQVITHTLSAKPIDAATCMYHLATLPWRYFQESAVYVLADSEPPSVCDLKEVERAVFQEPADQPISGIDTPGDHFCVYLQDHVFEIGAAQAKGE
jgi:hypothetical protein